ncbi:MlaD family protein, partial [Gordonia malaquae]|uniref:MlaD family protein n=1 Tax=Gordonia malaquae TaxID=410332 RepID=UPI001CBA69EE
PSGIDRMLTKGGTNFYGLGYSLIDVALLIANLRTFATAAGRIVDPEYSRIKESVAAIAPVIASIANSDIYSKSVTEQATRVIRDKLIPFVGSPDINLSDISIDGRDLARRDAESFHYRVEIDRNDAVKRSSSTLISMVALAVVFVVGLGYLVVGVARVNPTRSEYSLTAFIDSSGGLLDTSPVMVRGIPVGKVASINVVDSALKVEMAIDSDHKIPQDSVMSIQNLSIAGNSTSTSCPGARPPAGTSTTEMWCPRRRCMCRNRCPRCCRRWLRWQMGSTRLRSSPSTRPSPRPSQDGRETLT